MIIISGIMICHHYKDSAEQNEMYENLAEIVEETEEAKKQKTKQPSLRRKKLIPYSMMNCFSRIRIWPVG